MTNTESPLRAQNTVGGQRSRAKRRPHCPYFIPRVESLEERIVLDNRSAGMAGIMARGLRLADNVTALTGQNINIGQVEIGRPGLRTIPAVAFDDVNHSNATVVPQRVFFRDVSAGPNSELVYWQDGHATAVAGVIIANAVEPGVAPQAKLYASASSTVNAAQEVYYTDVLRSLQRVARPALAGEAAVQVRAINFSAAIPSPITGPGVGGNPPPISVDGTSLLSKGVDWLARFHDVLYVIARGNPNDARRNTPKDSYNGLVVGSTGVVAGGQFTRVDNTGHNNFVNAGNGRQLISLVAPGVDVWTPRPEAFGAPPRDWVQLSGSSFATPHVTGTVALLQQFAEDRIANSGNAQSWNGNARNHLVMKAVLMNSTDTVAGRLGMQKTILDRNGNGWDSSDARDEPVPGNDPMTAARQALPLDNDMGTGQLNATRALQQFRSGQRPPVLGPLIVPSIGWDRNSTTAQNQEVRYALPTLAQDSYIDTTLTWDRFSSLLDRVAPDRTNNVFDAGEDFNTATLTNLDLYLVPQGQGIGAAVWKSDSTLYNVEHMFFKILQTQRYDLIVRQTSPNPAGITETPFALAWWAQPTRAGAGMVQGTTFVDANKDDTWGTTENGYQGAFVDLYTADGVWVAATTTDSNGQYQFANLDAGDYYVVFTDPEGYTFANEHIGSDDAIDSDVDAYGQSDTFTITDDETVTLDAGLAPLPTGSISGKVWNDTDGDGIQDSGEAARDGVTVSLYDSSDNLLDSTATDADGAYEFNWLPAGDYYVTFAAPVNYGFTTQDAGSDDMLDSDADSSGVTATFTLGTDEEKAYVDAGLVLTASSVQGYIWNDTDSDGIQDNDEYPVPYAEVSLYDSSANLVATTTADDSGHYEFDLLSAGDYYVTFTLPYGFSDFSPQDQGSDDTLDSDADSSGQTATFTLGSTQILDHVDAGLVPVQYATISGSAWKDLNANGIQDSGEPGAANVFVDLYDSSDNWIDSTLSDADGHYQFLGVVPGDYYVQFNLPDHYVFTSQDAGSDDTVDSDADSSGLTATFTLSVAEELTHLDAGLQPINQAPAGANNTVKTPQDTPYVFTETDFGFTDPNDDPANLFYRVQIVTLPGAGTLTDNGTALSAGDFVTVSDIKNGKLVFTPATGAYGAAYASFTFAVQDDGGTANGGVDTDPTARTMTIDVVQTEPQLFDGEAVTPGPDVAPLTMTQLQPLLDEAIRRWVAATGDAQVGVRLQQAQVHITALSDAVLGLEGDNNIWIDLDAAGHGWFLDPTPGDDSEFANAVDGSEWHAGSDSAAAGRVDLLTVLEHELGHVLGLSDDSGTDLMVTTLGLGVRRLPAAP